MARCLDSARYFSQHSAAARDHMDQTAQTDLSDRGDRGVAPEPGGPPGVAELIHFFWRRKMLMV